MKPTVNNNINGYIINAEAASARLGGLVVSENICCCLCCCNDTGG